MENGRVSHVKLAYFTGLSCYFLMLYRKEARRYRGTGDGGKGAHRLLCQHT
jgi:hypothetical protein